MWAKSSMTFLESLTVSALGLCVVFTTLVVLALAIMIFSKIFAASGTGKPKAQAEPKTERMSAEADKADDDELAVLIAAVSEEVGEPVDRFRITEIREL